MLPSGVLRYGDCGSNVHYHFKQANPSIEYYNCPNYVDNRGIYSNTHFIRLDFLTREVVGTIQKLVQVKKNGNFWKKVAAEKSIELINQQRKMNKRHNDLGKYLSTAYEDKLKVVMDSKTFVPLSNQFKKERDQLEEAQQKSKQDLKLSRSYGTVSCILRGANAKMTSSF